MGFSVAHRWVAAATHLFFKSALLLCRGFPGPARLAGISLATTLPAEDVSHPGDHDSRTLMFLAGISAACKSGKRLRIIVDLLDPRNINLATNISADDVIIGAEMVSRFMVQIVSNKKRYRVYEELLS